MALFDYVLETGLVVPDTSTIKDEVIAEFKEALGADLVTDDETVQGTLIVGETLARRDAVRMAAQMTNLLNPSYAGGLALEAICALMGLERPQATASVLNVVILGGVPNTSIPAGIRAVDEAGHIWSLTLGVLIGVDGTTTGTFRCVETGPILCPVGSLHTLSTQLLGLETVTNPTAATVGSDAMSDADLRVLRNNTLARQGLSVPAAVQSFLYDPRVGCRSLAFRENVTDSTQVIDGVTMVAHSIWVCCEGGEDEAIALALLEAKTAGANWNGPVLVSVQDPTSGQYYSVRFQRPTTVPIEIDVTVRSLSYTGSPQAAVQLAVLNYAEHGLCDIRGFVLGKGFVSPAEIGAAIVAALPGVFISEIRGRRVGTTDWSYTEIALALWELPTIETSSVTVTVRA